MRVRLSLLAPNYKEESVMDFLAYINSYMNCAINDVSLDQVTEWYSKYPDRFPKENFRPHSGNMRFAYGYFTSYCSIPYCVGDLFHCEAIAYGDYFEEQAPEEDLIDIMELL